MAIDTKMWDAHFRLVRDGELSTCSADLSCHTCGSQTFSPQFPNFIIYLLFLTVLGLCCCTDFALVVASRGYSLVAVHGLLIVVASLVAEHRL